MALDRQEVLEKLQRHLRASGAYRPDEELGEDAELYHLDIDQAGIYQILIWADQEFRVPTGPSIKEIRTIGDLVTHIVEASELPPPPQLHAPSPEDS